MSTFPFFLSRLWGEECVTVEFNFHAGCLGAREHGLPLEPDVEPMVELASVTDDRGREVTLAPGEVGEIERECWRRVSEQHTEDCVERELEEVEV